MYLHLGGDGIIVQEDVVGIFNIETTTTSKTTRKYLSRAEKSGNVINVTPELPASFVVCSRKKKTGDAEDETIYISQISTVTLKKRSCSKNFERAIDFKIK